MEWKFVVFVCFLGKRVFFFCGKFILCDLRGNFLVIKGENVYVFFFVMLIGLGMN